MRNRQNTHKIPILPEKVIYKSEGHRQEKLTHYLQMVVEIADVGRLYAAKCFFNVEGEEAEGLSEESGMSEGSPTRQGLRHVLDRNIELVRNSALFSDSEESSRRFSQIMNNLGNE